MKDITSESKLDKRNKLEAYVFLPLYMVVIFLIAYIISLTISEKEVEIIAIACYLAIVAVVCYIFNPVFNAFEFKNIFIRHGDLSLIDKIKKFKPLFLIMYTLVPLACGIVLA